MVSRTQSSHTIAFQRQELADLICQASEDKPTGYWQIQLNAGAGKAPPLVWYLALSQGRIVFSGLRQLHWLGLLEILQRYIPRLRSSSVQQQIAAIEQGLAAEQRSSPMILLSQMIAKGITDYPQVTQAMQLQVLNDFDTYLFDYSGHAQFLLEPLLLCWPVFSALGLERLVAGARQRRQQWQQLEPLVPSIEGIPQLDIEAIARLEVRQKQHLQQLTSQGKTLREIACHLGKDSLEIAQTFARLGQNGLVTFAAVGKKNAPASSIPKIFIVDDSPVMLQNFKTIVTNLGYQVSCCSDALQAVPEMLASQPTAIFVDVNMPELSGFQLIKQIRLQPELASVPLVILTAEKSLSNQMRAKWSKSQFLTKPLNRQEMPSFYSQLRSLLQEIAPLPSSASSQAALSGVS